MTEIATSIIQAQPLGTGITVAAFLTAAFITPFGFLFYWMIRDLWRTSK